MNNSKMYKVRVLDDKCKEYIYNCKDYNEAADRFVFFVGCAVQMSLSCRCVNLLKSNKSIKMFQNH